MLVRHVGVIFSVRNELGVYKTFFPNSIVDWSGCRDWVLSVTLSAPGNPDREAPNILQNYGLLQRYSSSKYAAPNDFPQLTFGSSSSDQYCKQIDFHRVTLFQDSDLHDILLPFLQAMEIGDENCQDLDMDMQHFLRSVRSFDQGRQVFIRLWHPFQWQDALHIDYCFREWSYDVEDSARIYHNKR